MVPLPGALGGTELVAWRLDRQAYAATWDSGEGSFRAGGRWSSVGTRAVYCALDPATAIAEVAVHTGFPHLDTVPHVLTELLVDDPGEVHVVQPPDVPNPNWLVPGHVSPGQRAFGDHLLASHRFVVLPSVVSRGSWNLVFLSGGGGRYTVRDQQRFALDPRLHPSA
ncbi:RES family NAD+ phosphorylase [Jiella sp. M17.18]|uniref:RES family NAD+ phosphorylase n=1 Tax=Jiella sp. M17.18 TaxID=3234247 RepID=UPI0034DDEA83